MAGQRVRKPHGRSGRGRATGLAGIGIALALVATAVVTATNWSGGSGTSLGAQVGAAPATPSPSARVGLPGRTATIRATRATRPTGARPGRRPTAAAAAPGARLPAAVVPVRRPAAGVVPAGATEAGPRRFTFVNATGQTIWVAGWQQTATPALSTSGWVLPAGQRVTITVPDHWNGRFWGRTGCSFDSGGRGSCQTGDCGGAFQCRGYGAIPATLAEYNLNSWRNLDFYDVSMVDGSNLPMFINLTHGATPDPISSNGCSAAGCATSVACPAALATVVGGRAVACQSACARFNTDQYCCRAQWSSRPACDPAGWPVNYAAVFKKAEPFAYSYADDDATSTFTCTGECGYRITFGLSR